MKKLISIVWLLFGLKVLVLASQTQAPSDPAGQFILHAKESFFSGSLEFKIAFLDVELGKGKKTNSLSKALDNRNTNLEKAKKLLELAKEYLKEKPSASEALKQLYVQWISSMDSLPPHFTSEGYRQYERRLKEKGQDLNQFFERLEIELKPSDSAARSDIKDSKPKSNADAVATKTPDNKSPASEKGTEDETASAESTARISCPDSLREVPVSSSPRGPKSLKCGEQVTILIRSGNWIRIRTSDGKEGNVSAKFLEPEKP